MKLKPFPLFRARLVLGAAIIFEERSYRYILSALERSVMSDIFDTLKRLTGERLRHRIRLEEVRRMNRSELLRDVRGNGSGLEEVTAEEIDGLCDRRSEIGPEDSDVVILERLLKRERCALRFYGSMKRYAPEGELKRLFDQLMTEEKRYVAWIEEELLRAGV
jgi:rubrerythrin